MSIISKKICIICESTIDPNNLIDHFVDRRFSNKYLSTIGVTISQKNIELSRANSQGKLKLQLLIWKVTGHPKFKAIAPNYLQGSSGAVILVDVNSPETIERLSEHIQLFLSINPEGFIIVALNQSDLIAQEEQEKLMQLNNFEQVLKIYPTSAQIGSYFEEIFQQIAYTILKSCDNYSSFLQPYNEIEDASDQPRGEDSVPEVCFELESGAEEE